MSKIERHLLMRQRHGGRHGGISCIQLEIRESKSNSHDVAPRLSVTAILLSVFWVIERVFCQNTLEILVTKTSFALSYIAIAQP